MADLSGLIGGAYKKFLGRDPEAGAVESWSPTFQSNPAQGLAGIASSPEAQTYRQNQAVTGLRSVLNPQQPAPADTSAEQAGEAAARAQAGAPGGPTPTTPPPGGAGDIEKALYERAAQRINENYDLQARGQNEAAFARGIGSGTILPYYRDLLERSRSRELADASRAALTGAGAESRANEEARRKAEATTGDLGLRGRGLDIQELLGLLQLGQRESEFGRGSAQQAGQFGSNLNFQQDQLAAQQQAQFNNLLSQLGIGAGSLLLSNVGNLSGTVGGQAASGLARLFGSGGVNESLVDPALFSDPAALEALFATDPNLLLGTGGVVPY